MVAWQSRSVHQAAAAKELKPNSGNPDAAGAGSALPEWLWIALPACGSGLLLIEIHVMLESDRSR